MKTRLLAIALAAALLTPVIAETALTLTNTITLDTRGAGDLTVTGRVLNSQTNTPLAGAAVTLAGLSATSGSNGTFTLAGVSLASGADPAGSVTESDETNNTLSLPLNGVNLQLEYVSDSVLHDGSARVVARVKNLSAPESPVTMLRLKQKDAATTLAEINVSQLAPGESVEIPLDLPAGSQSEGTRSYRLTVDEDGLTGDTDVTNNELWFSLNLWIDDDGDGIPHEWEVANGMNDSNAADALLDPDGDGFNNRQEYLAGTDPRDASSKLKVGEVARQNTPDGLCTLVSWPSVAGRSYRLERSFDLMNWAALDDNVAATPPLNTVTDSAVAPSGKAFYRLVAAGQ